MSLSPLEYLRHILDEADYLAGEADTLTREAFLGDERAKRALVRSIEIIGEAAKKVPDRLKNRYPQVEWRAMAGMRDKVVHGKAVGTFGQVEYDAVTLHADPADLDAVWAAVQASDPHARLTEYRRFVDWYCRLHCVDLGDPAARDTRLATLVDDILATPVIGAVCHSY